MIDLNKLNTAISELEKSSSEFNNISVMVENAKELISKHVESEDRLEDIVKKVSGIAERCEEYEKTIGEELKDLIRDMNSKNLRLIDEYRKAIDFNYDSLTTEISAVSKKTSNFVCETVNSQTEVLVGRAENSICEVINAETIKLTDMVDSLIKKSEQDKNFVLKEIDEIKNHIKKNGKFSRICFICNMLLSLVTFIMVLCLLLH